MAVTGKTAHDLLEEKARTSVAALIDRMRRDTIEKATRIQLPAYAREAVKRIDRTYFRGKALKLFGPYRFHPDVQAFLPVMLLNDACDHRRLRDKLEDYARYMTGNYAWVWCTSPVTLPMRLQAKDLLLREGESEFGETPLASAMAFIRYHYEMMNLTSLTDYGTLYNRSHRLEQDGFFRNADVEGTSLFESFKEHPDDEVGPLTPGTQEAPAPQSS